MKLPVADLELSREDAIVVLSQLLSEHSVVVCTTVMASSELFEFRACEKNAITPIF